MEKPLKQDNHARQEKADQDLIDFFEQAQTAILSTVSSNGNPDASYAPVWLDKDRNFYVYVSSLAKHTANLLYTKKSSVLLIEDQQDATSLFARRRLSLECSVELVSIKDPQYRSYLDQFEKKFGEIIKQLRGMDDFKLFRMIPQKGRMVTGFAAAFQVLGTKIEHHLGGSHFRGGHYRKSSQGRSDNN